MVIDPHAEYGIAASRKHLQRVKGSPGFAIDTLDPSGRGVLLQFPAPVDQLPQPAPLCFDRHWQPHHDPSLCETPLRVGTLNVSIVNDAQLVGPGLVFTRDGMILDKSIGRHAERFGLATGPDQTCRLTDGLTGLIESAQRGGAVSTHERDALLLSDPATRHFGMWVLKCLPKLRILTLLAEAGIDVVVPADVPDKFLVLMESLGVGPKRVVFHDPQGISSYRRLIVPPKIYRPGSSRYGNPFEVFCTGARWDHRPVSRLARTGQGPERVYVSRRGNRRRRSRPSLRRARHHRARSNSSLLGTASGSSNRVRSVRWRRWRCSATASLSPDRSDRDSTIFFSHDVPREPSCLRPPSPSSRTCS